MSMNGAWSNFGVKEGLYRQTLLFWVFALVFLSWLFLAILLLSRLCTRPIIYTSAFIFTHTSHLFVLYGLPRPQLFCALYKNTKHEVMREFRANAHKLQTDLSRHFPYVVPVDPLSLAKGELWMYFYYFFPS